MEMLIDVITKIVNICEILWAMSTWEIEKERKKEKNPYNKTWESLPMPLIVFFGREKSKSTKPPSIRAAGIFFPHVQTFHSLNYLTYLRRNFRNFRFTKMTVWLHDCRLDAIMTWELLNICFCRFWTPKILSSSIFGIQQTVSEQNGVVFGFFCWCCEYGKSEFSLCFNEHRKQKKKRLETSKPFTFLFLNRWFGCSFGKKKVAKIALLPRWEAEYYSKTMTLSCVCVCQMI